MAARMRVNGRRGFGGGGIVGCAVLVIVGGVVWCGGVERAGRGADSAEGWGRSALKRDRAALNVIPRCTKAAVSDVSHV